MATGATSAALSNDKPLTIGFDGFTLDEANAQLLRGGEAIPLAPKPFGYALRVNGCVWNSVVQMDRFVAAAQDLVHKMSA